MLLGREFQDLDPARMKEHQIVTNHLQQFYTNPLVLYICQDSVKLGEVNADVCIPMYLKHLSYKMVEVVDLGSDIRVACE